MINVGEQLVSSYLRYIRGCDFIDTNVRAGPQGEIDVIGQNLTEGRLYVCEVAIHLKSGLRYVDPKKSRPNTVQKLTDKFSKDIEYARKHLAQYEHRFMLWSPIVRKNKRTLKNSQLRHLKAIQSNIKKKYDVEIECIVNEKFQECFEELESYAKQQTNELQCPVMRVLQIRTHLDEHLAKLD